MPALYEVVLNATYSNQQIINRWNYVLNTPPTGIKGSEALARAMGCIPSGGSLPTGTMFEKIRALQASQVEYEQIIVKEIWDLADFYTAPFIPHALGSTSDGKPLSPVMSYGFVSTQTTRAVRRGTKRFTGIPGSAAEAGGGFTGGALTAMDTLAAAMTDNLTYTPESGSPSVFQPVIVGKQDYVVPGSDPPRTAYKYYPDYAAQLPFLAFGIVWSKYTQQRSQTSRQYGKGI